MRERIRSMVAVSVDLCGYHGGLEAAPIGKQIFAHGISERDPTAFWLVLDTYATRLLAQALSLRFNYEGFCEGLYSIAKPFAFAQFVASGGRFDGRVALGPAGEP